jgi:hypothetical protein
MEELFQFAQDGQEVQQDDLTLVAENAARADDRVFAELARLCPLAPGGSDTPARGIMPFAISGVRDPSSPLPTALVSPNGATGAVKVAPFRAFIGSRVVESSDARSNWQDTRSTLSVAKGSTSLYLLQAFAANTSGQPRWDLLYALVTIDASAQTTNRYYKDTTDDSPTPVTVTVTVLTTVSIGVVQGTANASPQPPSAPADTATTFAIPIALVLIPNGFGASSTIAQNQIATRAPLVGLNSAASGGGMSIEPMDSAFDALLSNNTNTGWRHWGASGGTRPPAYMPSTFRGGFMKQIAVDIGGQSYSITPSAGDVIDASRDWRRRTFMWLLQYGNAGEYFPWEEAAAYPASMFFGRPLDPATGCWGAGQSFYDDTQSGYGPAHSTILEVIGGTTSPTNLTSPKNFYLVVDQTNGNLVVEYNTAGCGIFHVLLIASGQFENA